MAQKSNLTELYLKYGQSVWLDSIDRGLLRSGKLRSLVAEHGLRGLTSNPAIFEKAMVHSDVYDEQIKSLLEQGDWEVKALYEELAIADIQAAADILRPVYDSSQGRDGMASFEVSPSLARDTRRTIEEAKRLRARLARPNVMIKVPGTKEGIPAVRALIAEGLNINITLLFSRAVYGEVAEAYMQGLEDRLAQGKDIRSIASVASFFVSRIDTAVDRKLGDPRSPLSGKIAIANAKLAYELYLNLVATDRWKRLEAAGAQRQRLLWASTSVKNPAYPDVLYVNALIGNETVNTLPPATLKAFEDHGKLAETLTQDLDGARSALSKLMELGISLDAVTDQLTVEAIQLFLDPFETLLASLERKKRRWQREGINPMALRLPIPEMTQVDEVIRDWRATGKVRRLWDGDASIWTGKDEAKWLGWLRAVDRALESPGMLEELEQFRSDVLKMGIKEVVLLGMGGSSLAPEVFDKTFDPSVASPDFHVLDSTNPEQIRELERKIDPSLALFIVSSKSGTTLEPNIYCDYFHEKVKGAVGEEKAGLHFVAITDPGSKLELMAAERGFLRVFHGEPSIGGRYSALSPFGLVPAALIGVDLKRFLKRARAMVSACSANVPPEENPGVILGAVLGALGNRGRDKVTLICSPEIEDLAAWLEQLLAESTGKGGKGLIPIAEEPVGTPESYDDDRLFIYLRNVGDMLIDLDPKVDALEKYGHPVVRIDVDGTYALGQEFFRWEMATAVAGSVLGLNPFDQPDVESSKVAARKLTTEIERTGKLPEEGLLFEENGIRLFADPWNASELRKSLGNESPSLARYLKAHFDRLKPRDYAAILAYLDMNLRDEDALQEIRVSLRCAYRVATCMGFGPRFLHSTGQAYKGGPNSGVFLQITAERAKDLPIPGHRLAFGQVQAAQALGDFQVLAERKRRCLRAHLPANHAEGLRLLCEAVQQATGKGRLTGRYAA